MKYRYLLLLIIPFFIYCPKRGGVKTQNIEVFYLSSLSDDISLDKPVLAGVPNMKGIKVGYLFFEQPFMSEFYYRLGFYKILDDLQVDFLITDYPVYGQKCFSIKRDLGYGITNYKGIRFAIFSLDKDSLSISDQTKLALARERSDLLWLVDSKMLAKSAMRMNFIIKNRILRDTIMSRIDVKPDTQFVSRITNFRTQLNAVLNRKWNLENKKLDDYVLAKIAEKIGVNVVLYPAQLFKRVVSADSITIADFISNVACEMKFGKEEAVREEIQKLMQKNNYSVWGKIEKTNAVLLPSPAGDYIFDLIFN